MLNLLFLGEMQIKPTGNHWGGYNKLNGKITNIGKDGGNWNLCSCCHKMQNGDTTLALLIPKSIENKYSNICTE